MSEEIVPRKTYVYVFLALAILTATTAGVSHLDLGWGNAPVALLIAFCKAALVALFFMHVRQSRHVIWLVIFSSLFCLAILIVLSMADYGTRTWTAMPRGL